MWLPISYDEITDTCRYEVNALREWRLPSGALHRVAGPAVERSDGLKEWWLDGQFSLRENGTFQRHSILPKGLKWAFKGYGPDNEYDE